MLSSKTMGVTITAPLSRIDHDQISGAHGILKFKAGTAHETFGVSKCEGTPHVHTSCDTVGSGHLRNPLYREQCTTRLYMYCLFHRQTTVDTTRFLAQQGCVDGTVIGRNQQHL